jgi:uncharacterized Fe-S cluster-containing radical SAM superfamily protein
MKQYQYASTDLLTDKELTQRQEFLLKESQTFCMYPWTHLYLNPDGNARPCCMSEWQTVPPLGNANHSSLKEIWNGPGMRQLRVNMLNEQPSPACTRCYEIEKSGFFGGRRSANKHLGHYIDRVDATREDGHLENFEMIYWDVRFSNLCNLKCRSCGHLFSTQWYQDQVALAGPEYANKHKPLIFAGRHETDIWDQLVEHIDYVERIYFAGGEPLIMKEHYQILDELIKRQKFNVRLNYNTNFTQIDFKDKTVFDYWNQFDRVSVGASLDGMGPRAEYIRKNTEWHQVEANRVLMKEQCPKVDFYVSSTLSILNALHLPDFHRDWVNKELIEAQAFNVNILQDPDHLRVDIATPDYKNKIHAKYLEHLEWLKPRDRLRRASMGFESAINYMMATDNQHLIPKFWKKTDQLDTLRNEKCIEAIPELAELR